MRIPTRGELGPFRWHRTNENEDDRGEKLGSSFWQGRAWLHYSPEDGRRRGPDRCLSVEWCVGRRSKMCGVSFQRDDGERDLTASVRIPGVLSLYYGLEGFFDRFQGPSREVGVSYFEGSVHWRLWSDPDSWSSTTPRWRDGSWRPVDTFLGPIERERRILEVRQVEIPFPERSYRATVSLVDVIERRPRWPGVWERWRGADIEPEAPVPEPGKGENSWDCGEDACHAMWTGGVRDVHEAVERFRSTIMRTRERRGGEGWRPEEKRAP